MIKSLRTKHRQIWLFISLSLPIMVVFSWLIVPNAVPVKTVLKPAVELLPIIKAKKETEQYCVLIRSNLLQNAWQLEWKNKTALTVPSAVIYQQSLLVGRIESRGDYVFPVQSGDFSFVLYDFIHEKIIDSFQFKIL